MRTLLLLSVMGALVTVAPAASISFEVTDLGGNQFRYSYTFTGLSLQANQEIDIRFDPALYANLSNGIAPPQFDLLVLQPNNPPGTFGDYSILSLINNPDLTGNFSVEFQFLGSGQPGAQPYLINEYDATGDFVGTVGRGMTQTAADPADVPEPQSLWLVGLSLLAVRAARSC